MPINNVGAVDNPVMPNYEPASKNACLEYVSYCLNALATISADAFETGVCKDWFLSCYPYVDKDENNMNLKKEIISTNYSTEVKKLVMLCDRFPDVNCPDKEKE